MTFQKYLQEIHSTFILDSVPHSIVKAMDMWVQRDRKFEEGALKCVWGQKALSLEKGFLLVGPVGVGKTVLLELFQRYLHYVKHPAFFKKDIVWNLADEFQSKGPEVFRKNENIHMLFDELALKDESTNTLKAEEVSHFGNKILVGEKLIRHRYENFGAGILTHFTTNEKLEDIQKFYGARTTSRLLYMVNVVQYVGADRRKAANVTVFNGKKSPVIIPERVESKNNNDDLEIRVMLNHKYEEYCLGGDCKLDWSHYAMLRELDPDKIMTDKEVQVVLMPEVEKERRQYVKEFKHGKNRQESMRITEVRNMYLDGRIDEEEKTLITRSAYKRAMLIYFEKKKREGATKLF